MEIIDDTQVAVGGMATMTSKGIDVVVYVGRG